MLCKIWNNKCFRLLFSFAEFKPLIQKDHNAATVADKYSKYLYGILTLKSIREDLGAVCFAIPWTKYRHHIKKDKTHSICEVFCWMGQIFWKSLE